MRPLKTAASCLKCHAAQGYKEGDIRGGISVAVHMKDYEAIAPAAPTRGATRSRRYVGRGTGGVRRGRPANPAAAARAVTRRKQPCARARSGWLRLSRCASGQLALGCSGTTCSNGPRKRIASSAFRRATPLTYEMFLSCVHPEDREYVDQALGGLADRSALRH